MTKKERVLNSLSKAAMYITTLSIGASLSGLVVECIGVRNSNELMQKFLEEKQDYYAANLNEDVSALTAAFANGEITKEEYDKKLDYYSSGEYTFQLMKKYEVENKSMESPYVEDAIKAMTKGEIGSKMALSGCGISIGMIAVAAFVAFSCSLADMIKERKELKQEDESTIGELGE